MPKFISVTLTLFLSILLLTSCSKENPSPSVSPSQTSTSAPKKFKICWSIYVGWMPWDYASQKGIIKKWADKYDIDIEVTQINDYVESINQYTSGAYDGCSMTNMDALTIPAAGGVDSTALIVGDFSNGNDGLVLKEKSQLSDIKGQTVNLVELSVSHYLLARALSSVGMTEQDVKVVNISDADLVAAFATPDVTATVTWNPLLSEVATTAGAHLVFDSGKIPGEIIDLMVVNTKTLKENPAFGKALTGAWYEMMAIMSAGDVSKAAKEFMGKASGTDLAGFESQLMSTKMFYQPKDAVDFVTGENLKKTMQYVAEFSVAHGLLGEGVKDAGAIGIEMPAGLYGTEKNIKLRFDPTYMQMAVDGKL
jgi:NitT/TauT family transport system substrate-binding protein